MSVCARAAGNCASNGRCRFSRFERRWALPVSFLPETQISPNAASSKQSKPVAPGPPAGAWAAFAEGLSDFEALDASHLAAFEALAASLAAVDRGGRLQLWERIAGDTR